MFTGGMPTDRRLAQLLKELAEHPRDATLLAKVAELLQRLGDKKAGATYYALLADVYAMDGYLMKAVAVAKQALKLDPKNTGLHQKLAKWHLALGLEPEAALYLQGVAAHQSALGDADGVAETMATMHKLGWPTVPGPTRREIDDATEAARHVRLCLFCQRQSAPVAALPGKKAFLCIPCARRVGRFYLDGSEDKRGTVWRPLPAPNPSPADEDSNEEPASEASGMRFDIAISEVFSEFKKGLERAGGQDPQLHADLAIAYREMGLIADAMKAAARALALEGAPTVAVATQALALLLEPKMLNPGALEKLKLALFKE